MPNAAIIYTRVSSKAQEDGASLEDQERAGRQLAESRGYEVSDQWVLREVWTGTQLARPLLDRARASIREGKAAALVVWTVDRLSRDPVHVLLIAEECDRMGIPLLFVQEPADFSLEGQLLTFVRGWASKLENVRRAERSRIGKRAKAQAGRLPQGDGAGLYGYQLVVKDRGRPRRGMRAVYGPDPGRRLILDHEAQVVRRIFAWLVNERLSLRKIAARLREMGEPSPKGGEWHWDVLRRLTRNKAYVGDALATPPIIDRETFDRTQGQLQRNAEMSSRNRRHEWLLSGYIYCGGCGQRMHGVTGNQRRYYRCQGRWQDARRPCQVAAIRAEGLEGAVWGEVARILGNPSLIQAEIERLRVEGTTATIEANLTDIKSRLDHVENQKRTLVRLYRYGEIDDAYILREWEALEKEGASCSAERQRLSELRERDQELTQASLALEELCQGTNANLEAFGYQDKRLALEALGVKVVVGDDGGTVLNAVVPVASPTYR